MLRRQAARGALASVCSQACTLIIRTGSMIIMARLLTPKDFGLVGMAAAVTGFLGLFRDLGLSSATIQSASITSEQTSTLFWINVAAGGSLAAFCVVLGPAIAAFYGDSRLFWVTAASGTSFLFNGVAAQHRAIVQREMRFIALAVIDVSSLVLSLAVGLGMGLAGAGYWSLIASAVSQQAAAALGYWAVSGWMPGRPSRRSGVRAMLKYGGAVTVNSLLAYLTYNIDKVLIGRICGADALGIYGRAYQLVNLPTENLNMTIGQVAFPALSRVQNDPVRLRSYFVKGYGLFLALVLPITMACVFFAEDIIRVLFGPKWHEVAGILRLLAPTILAFALDNPFAWLLQATGRVGRNLRIGLALAPIVILAYALGLQSGPKGVAIGFSVAMMGTVVPVIFWAKYGTLITGKDIWMAVLPPAVSILLAAAVTAVLRTALALVEPVFWRLVLETGVMLSVYLVVLLFVMNQKTVFVQLMRKSGVWPVWTRRDVSA